MHPAINKLIAPSQRRPAIWRGGILQLMVTRSCDESCHGCTQGSNLAGKPALMTPVQFEQAVDSLDGYWGVYGLFGGNPAVSPYFEDYCRILKRVPWEQRGLWCNNLRGKGAIARQTFNPAVSNLNVHLNSEAADEIRRDWPEAARFIKGIDRDSLHGTPWVSMVDLGIPEEERWRLISDCDIQRHWSSLIGIFRGELRAYLCEVAYAMASLHQDNPDWAGTGQPVPDTGLAVTRGWWRKPLADFEAQVNTHCHHCAVPLRRPPQLAIGGTREEFSRTHEFIARPKTRGRVVDFVGVESLERSERPATQYLPGTTPGYRGQ